MDTNKTIRMLYDIQRWFAADMYKCTADKIGKRAGVNIEIEFCDSDEILPMITKEPKKYDYVIIHLGESGREYVYRQAREVRNIWEKNCFPHGVLVAESGFYPRCEDEVMQFFDHYAYYFMKENEMTGMLKKFGHLPKDFGV